MSIHSTTDSDGPEIPDTAFAASAVTTGLAATAASLLRNDPGRQLPPRLLRSLELVRDRLAKLMDIDDREVELLLQPMRGSHPDPDQALARFATQGRNEASREEFLRAQESLAALKQAVERLITDPNREDAEEVEEFFGVLSQHESDIAGAMLRSDEQLEDQLAFV